MTARSKLWYIKEELEAMELFFEFDEEERASIEVAIKFLDQVRT